MFNKLFVQWNFLNSQSGFRKAPLMTLFRLVLWRVLCLIGKPVYIYLPAWGIKMYLPPEWHGTAKLLFVFRNEYEPELSMLNHFLVPGSVMVDVGANYGVYSLYASYLVGDGGHVIAFEPAQRTFDILKKNLALNYVSNATCVQAALSNQEGEALLYHDPDPSRNSLAGGAQNQEYEKVQVHTLDEALFSLGVTKVDFIKIDAEGADELVCRGAQVTLKTSKPIVLFEYNPLASTRMGLRPDGVWKFLATLGYSFHVWTNAGLHPVSCEDISGGNVLALHLDSEIKQ